MDEEQIHFDAFELFFTLRQEGLQKTNALNRVASELNRGNSTLFDWYNKLGWEEKESVRAAQIREEIQKKTDSTITDNKIKYMGIVHSPLNQYVKDVNNGKREPVKINTTRDIEILIKLGLLIQGESTERTEQEIKADIKTTPIDEFNQIMDESLENIETDEDITPEK